MARKGFPVRMSLISWMGVRQVYEWLRANNLTDPELDEVAKLLPMDLPDNFDAIDAGPSDFSWKQVRAWRDTFFSKMATPRGAAKSKTIRVRAHQLCAMKRLLLRASVCSVHGASCGLILSRIDDLNRAAPLELIADASRK